MKMVIIYVIPNLYEISHVVPNLYAFLSALKNKRIILLYYAEMKTQSFPFQKGPYQV